MTGPFARIPALLFLAFLAAALAAAQHEPYGRLDPDRLVDWAPVVEKGKGRAAHVTVDDRHESRFSVRFTCAKPATTPLRVLISQAFTSLSITFSNGPAASGAEAVAESRRLASDPQEPLGFSRPGARLQLVFRKRGEDSRETLHFFGTLGPSPRHGVLYGIDAARALARIHSSEEFSFRIFHEDASLRLSPAVPVTARAREYLGMLARVCMLDLRHAASL